MKRLFCWFLIINAVNTLVYSMHGGEFHDTRAVPYQAQVYVPLTKGSLYCGAAILSEYWLLSAAHCVGHESEGNIFVRLGSSSTVDKGKLIKVIKIIVHGEYDDINSYESDVCLLKIESPIEFDEYQQPIPLGKETPKMGDMITVSGFGRVRYDIRGRSLKVGVMPVVNLQLCLRIVDRNGKNLFCTNAVSVDLCPGDSGSPAVFDDKVVGVVSRGTCKHALVNVFTDVTKYYDWILKHTGIEYED